MLGFFSCTYLETSSLTAPKTMNMQNILMNFPRKRITPPVNTQLQK